MGRTTSQQGCVTEQSLLFRSDASPPPPTTTKAEEPIHSRDISLETGSADKVSKLNDDVESLETNGDQSPSEPKHTETQHEETSPTPVTPSSPTVEDLKKRLAWATTELALAQSKGYIPDRSTFSASGEDDLTAILKTDIPLKDTKLLQALLSTRHQLSRVKELVNDQTKSASEKIADAERQRDDALGQIAYLRGRLAAAQSGDTAQIPQDRADELSKKLVAALAIQSELSLKVEDLTKRLEIERMARQTAEDAASSHFDRFNEAEERRRDVGNEVVSLRSRIAEAERTANVNKGQGIEDQTRPNNLRIEAEELQKQVVELMGWWMFIPTLSKLRNRQLLLL